MVSSKNPVFVVPVPQEIVDFSLKRPEIVCNLRPSQRPVIENETEDEKRIRRITEYMFDGAIFYRPMEDFLKGVEDGERLVLVCQSFGKDVFTFVADVEKIYWADGHYPRVDFKRKPRIFHALFGGGNLWGGFILAAAKVGRVKKQARMGYDLLFEISWDGLKK